ncbi:hypothetical protein PYW07_006961 [Mythimna separata]|uniref:Uncharacterized protein n=1 Tax=Mythimna separata TaxID=271217 RepID=A0AAD8E124_MYTSE|nr:hypothetical protein PYW07_006961 [Mythimna separata]
MSDQSLEKTIRELAKTVHSLENKIISLEKVVVDQTHLIKKLISVSDVSEESAQNSVNVGKRAVNIEQRTQRPIRDARVRAESALSAAAASKTKGARNISPAVRAARPAAPDPNASTSVYEPLTPTQLIPSDASQPPPHEFVNTTTLSMNHTQLNDNNNDLDWIEVKQKRSRRPPANVTRGTAPAGSSVCALSAAERKSYLHLYYVQTGTTAEQVIAHLQNICANDKCSAEVLKSRGDYASFKLTVPTKNVDNYMKPEHWAENVHIKPWRSGFHLVLSSLGVGSIDVSGDVEPVVPADAYHPPLSDQTQQMHLLNILAQCFCRIVPFYLQQKLNRKQQTIYAPLALP